MSVISNPSADRQEKIANAARILRASSLRRMVFEVVYAGHRKFKNINQIQAAIKNNSSRVYKAAAKLAAEDIFAREKNGTTLSFGKQDFYTHNKQEILKLATNKILLDRFPTRERPQVKVRNSPVVFSNRVRIEQVYAEDFLGFKKICGMKSGSVNPTLYSEAKIKEGFKKLLNVTGKFTDWGGEQNDLSTKALVKGKRLTVAFALKGPGKQGVLTPAGMGKNGDQIGRLFHSPADVFIVQYHDQIDFSVLDLMKGLAVAESVKLNKKVYFGIIDGADTSRILTAYSSVFR